MIKRTLWYQFEKEYLPVTQEDLPNMDNSLVILGGRYGKILPA